MKMRNNLCLIKETRVFGKFVYIIVMSMYFAALMILSCCAEVFPDRNTAFVWFSEIMNAANKALFIGIFFCLIYELLD